MQFQIFQIPYLGNGMTLGLNAVIHIIISHGLAIGLLAMIAVSEQFGFRKNNPDGDRFAKYLLNFSVIVITGIGSITGVGIWFTTSAFAPHAIGSMLRIFFWPWFIEWIVFILEAGGLLLLYFTWDKWAGEKRKYRIILTYFYAAVALASAVLITGIIAFMLTPGEWTLNRSRWAAFFNSTFPPQLMLRLGASVLIGVIVAMAFLLFTKREEQLRKGLLTIFGYILLGSTVLTGLFAWWYFGLIPPAFTTYSIALLLTSHLSQASWIFWSVNIAAFLILLFYGFLALGKKTVLLKIFAVPGLLLTVFLPAEYEMIREHARAPYLMPGFMYSNQLMLDQSYLLRKEGMLQNAYWFSASGGQNKSDYEKGFFLFGQNCASCHTVYGVNAIARRIAGRTRDGIEVMIKHLDEMTPFMPPFSGSDEERRLVADFLYELSGKREAIGAPHRFSPVKALRK